MIKVKKDKIKIEVPKDEKRPEAFLIAELSVALIEVANYLKKDKEEILNRLNFGVFFIDDVEEIINDFKECIGGKNG